MSKKSEKKQSFRWWLTLPVVAFVVVAVAWFLVGHTRTESKIKNILFISIDTCRADYLSCYGCRRLTTPNIDQLARQSTIFTNAISPVPITLPAHCSMLTGTIPPYHGVHDNSDFKLADSHKTLAEILKTRGFLTAAIVSAFVLDSQFGLNQGFDYYNDRFEKPLNTLSTDERRGQEASRFAMQWLQENRDKKFFLFLHYFDPHTAYVPPEPFASRFADNLYAGEIAYTDYCIAQVIRKLKDLGLYDSTLIIIAGDHGEMLGEHGEGAHSYFIYQSALKVPLIFKLPGQIRPKRINDLVGLIDIVPTLCTLLGIRPPPQAQGKDLSPYLTQKPYSQKERYVYAESLYPTKYNANSLLGLLTNRWKYIQTTRPELYDLINDPQEADNLLKQQPQQARILQDRLKQILEQTVRKDETDSRLELSEQARRRLESLGYISGKISGDFEFDQSRDDPKDLIGFHLDNATVHRLIFQKNYDQAKKICEKLLKERPQSPSIYLFLAKIATVQNDFTAAMPHLYEALRLNPDQFEVHRNLGMALSRSGKPEQALKHCRQALKISPWEPTAHIQLADVLTQLGNFDEAAEHYKEALRLGPTRPQVLNNLAASLTEQGNYEQAMEYFAQALQIDPNTPDALDNLKKTFLLLGKTDKAVECYEKLLQKYPNQFLFHNELAAIFYKQDKLEKAAAHLNQSLRLKPNQLPMLENLASTYLLQGRTDLAADCWQKGLQLQPDWVTALNELAWIKATSKDPNLSSPREAVKLAHRACELTEFKEPQMLDTLSVAYAKAGSLPQAIKTAEKAMGLALSQNKKQLAESIEKHLAVFKNRPPN